MVRAKAVRIRGSPESAYPFIKSVARRGPKAGQDLLSKPLFRLGNLGKAH